MASRRSSATHAISAPSFENNHIHRPRLVDRLLAANGARVALVVASAGYGKTTLLSDFNRLSTDPVCWLRLNEADRDLLTLAGLVWASLERRFYRLRGELDINRMDGLSARAVGGRIASALEEKVPERFAFVIEDLHLVEGEAPVLNLVQALVDELPRNVFLLLSSRRVPNLKLVDLIASDGVVTIGAEELAFDRPELRDLVQARLGDEPDEDLLTALMNETGGWVTGVLLSERLLDPNALPLNGRPEPMSFEYLTDNALERVSPQLQDFMLRTAILPYMTGAICDQLLEKCDSEAILEELVRRGLFTSVTLNNPRTYEYHHALSQFLRTRAQERLAEQVRSQLALKAAEILEAEGQEYTALKILLESGFEEQAVELAKRFTRALFCWAPVSLLAKVGRMLVDSGVQCPKVFMRIAVASPQAIESGERAYWMSLARECQPFSNEEDEVFLYGLEADIAGKLGDRRGLTRAIRSLRDFDGLSDLWHKTKLARARADLESLDAGWDRACEILEQGRAQIRQMTKGRDKESLQVWMRETIGIFLTRLANVYVCLGKLEMAEIRLVEALQMVDETASARAGAAITNNLGCVLHNIGDYDRARNYLLRSISISEELEDPTLLAFAHSSYADLLSDGAVPDLSAAHYSEAARWAEIADHSPLKSYIYGGLRVLSYRYPGLANGTEKRANNGAPFNDGSVGEVFTNRILCYDLSEPPDATLSKLLVIQDDPSLNFLERTLARTWSAILTLKTGDEHLASDQFKQALNFAANNSTVQLVAAHLYHEDKRDQEILLSAIQNTSGYAELTQLMSALERFSRSFQGSVQQSNSKSDIQIHLLGMQRMQVGGTTIHLRPKHMEVLAYLAVHGQINSESVIEAIWPNAAASSSAARLHTAIYEIRRALGEDVLTRSNGQYLLESADTFVDSCRFERLAKEVLSQPLDGFQMARDMDDAIEIYSGLFYPSCDAEWAVVYRRELQRLYSQLILERSRWAIERGDAWQVVLDMKDLLDFDPFNDQAHVILLRALGSVGHSGELVSHFLRSSTLYREELDIDIPDEIVHTYRSLVD